MATRSPRRAGRRRSSALARPRALQHLHEAARAPPAAGHRRRRGSTRHVSTTMVSGRSRVMSPVARANAFDRAGRQQRARPRPCTSGRAPGRSARSSMPGTDTSPRRAARVLGHRPDQQPVAQVEDDRLEGCARPTVHGGRVEHQLLVAVAVRVDRVECADADRGADLDDAVGLLAGAAERRLQPGSDRRSPSWARRGRRPSPSSPSPSRSRRAGVGVVGLPVAADVGR